MSARADGCNYTASLERETWFAARIAERTGGKFACTIFAGVTDRAIRAGRARALILEHRLAAARVFPTKPDSFADLFRRLYHEPLALPPDTASQLQLEVAV